MSKDVSKKEDPDPENFVTRSAKSLQENMTRSGGAAAASYGLIGGVIMFGGIGYALDRWRGTTPWFLLGGLLLGLIVGFYDLARTIFRK